MQANPRAKQTMPGRAVVTGLGIWALLAGFAPASNPQTAPRLAPPGGHSATTLAVVKGRTTVPAKQAQAAPKPTKILWGDVAILRSVGGDFDPVGGFAHLKGNETEIEVPDKANHSVFRVHADDIEMRKVGDDLAGNIDLSGHIRYTLIQQTKAGERKVVGTAGHGALRRASHHIELTNGFQATLTDPALLSGPGKLRAGNAIVDLSTTPYLYTLEGKPSANDVQFTLRGKPDKEQKPTERGTAHIYGYENGTLQIGETAHFSGTGTTVDLISGQDHSPAQIQAHQILVEFSSDGLVIQQAEASGSVRYRIEKLATKERPAQIVTGTATRATFTEGTTNVVKAFGPLRVNINDPKLFADVATITGEQGDTVQVNIADTGTTFHYATPNETMAFHFVPVANAEKKPAPDKQTTAPAGK